MTRLDHDANIRPWVPAAEARRGDACAGSTSTPRPASSAFDPAVLSERTRLVAVTGASNLLGTRPDLAGRSRPPCTRRARCCSSTACTSPRTPRSTSRDLGADFYACSPYKFFGPHLGVLAADPALLETLHPDKLLPSTDAVPGALRARHAALRAARRRHRGGRLHRRARAWRGGRPADPGGGVDAGPSRHEDGLFERLLAGLDARRRGASLRPPRAAYADGAVLGRGAHRPRGVRAPRRAGRERPGQQLLRPRGVPAARASATPARCGPAWRRTPPTTTSTGCSPGSPSWPDERTRAPSGPAETAVAGSHLITSGPCSRARWPLPSSPRAPAGRRTPGRPRPRRRRRRGRRRHSRARPRRPARPRARRQPSPAAPPASSASSRSSRRCRCC